MPETLRLIDIINLSKAMQTTIELCQLNSRAILNKV